MGTVGFFCLCFCFFLVFMLLLIYLLNIAFLLILSENIHKKKNIQNIYIHTEHIAVPAGLCRLMPLHGFFCFLFLLFLLCY